MHSRHSGTPSLFPLVAALAVALLFFACNHDGESSTQGFVPGDDVVACGNWTAFVQDTSGYWVLKIRGIEVGEETGDATLPIGAQQQSSKFADVALYRLDRKDAMRERFCNDVATDILVVDSLTAHSGSVQARKYDLDPDPYFATFRLDLEVRDARFKREDGSELRIEHLRLDSLFAGWVAG